MFENAQRTAADRAGIPVRTFSAQVWEGVKATIKKYGALFGQKYGAHTINDEVGGFGDLIMPIVEDAAKKWGVSVAEVERRLKAGETSLLGTVLSTGIGAEAYRLWQQEQQGGTRPARPGGPLAPPQTR
jgi:hypothetical protein